MKRRFESYTSAFAHPSKIKLGLDLIAKFDAHLGYPSKAFESIHIAGTNGKGSVATKIAHTLYSLGKRVGLYTSPHLLSFQERIWANGSLISEEAMRDYVHQVEVGGKELGVSPTFFELFTLIAFLHFAEKKVEIAVIEVGMGGRLDATNIVQPLLSVITSIGFDHNEYLGDTLEKIAFEKAGIIKKGCPVILGGAVQPLSLFQKVAKERGSPLFVAKYERDFDLQNQQTASLALDHLPFAVATKPGLLVRPFGRFEMIREDPPVILDVAHNEAALKALFRKIEKHFPKQPITVVASFSCLHKAPIMANFLKKRAIVYLTKATHERAVTCPPIKGCYSENNVKKALSLAQERGGLLLVTGTFFMMEETYSFFGVEGVRGQLVD